MKHCLNKRDHYENAQIDTEEQIEEELQTERRLACRELPLSSNARRRPDVDELKSYVKELKEFGLRSCHAYEVAARDQGYKTYNAYLADIK